MNKQEIVFIERYGNKITTPTGEEFYYIPFWFKCDPKNGVYDKLSFSYLPEDVKEYVIKSREELKKK